MWISKKRVVSRYRRYRVTIVCNVASVGAVIITNEYHSVRTEEKSKIIIVIMIVKKKKTQKRLILGQKIYLLRARARKYAAVWYREDNDYHYYYYYCYCFVVVDATFRCRGHAEINVASTTVRLYIIHSNTASRIFDRRKINSTSEQIVRKHRSVYYNFQRRHSDSVHDRR